MPSTIISNAEIESLHTRVMSLSKEIDSKSGELCETLLIIRDQFLYQQMGFKTFGDYVTSLPISSRYIWIILDTYNSLIELNLTKKEATEAIKEYGYQKVSSAVDLAESEEEMREMLNKTHPEIDLSDRRLVSKKRSAKRGSMKVYFATEEQAVLVTEGMYKLETALGISQATLLEYMVVSALQDQDFIAVERVSSIADIESIAEQIERESLDKQNSIM